MRRRVLLSMVLVTAVAVAIFAVPLGVAASRLYRSREVSRLEREATRAAGAFPSSESGAAPSPVLPESDPGVRLALYDRDGRLLVGTGPRTGGTEVRSAIGGRVTDDHDGAWLAVAVPVHDEQQIVGAARAAVAWDEVAGDSRKSWLVMAAIAGIAVGIAGLLAWWQTSRLVEPIDELTGLAGRLGDGDFTARVAPTGVSEIDGAGRALNRTAERLGTLVGRERAFTADVSHQLNTPLTSLRLALESALVTPGADATAAIETAIGEVERLEATVTTLLAVARDVAPVLGPPIDVGDVCAEIAERFRGDLARAGRPLHVDVAEGLPRTTVPVEVLREILAVLVSNAARHGGGTITVAARAAGRGLVVEVADEGAGIADASHLFERRSTDAAGHGIGLALARSIAEAHECRLEVTRLAPSPTFALALPGVG